MFIVIYLIVAVAIALLIIRAVKTDPDARPKPTPPPETKKPDSPAVQAFKMAVATAEENRQRRAAAGPFALPASIPSPVDASATVSAIHVCGDKDGCFQEVVGESHYQSELEWLEREFAAYEQCGVMMVPEPDNKYDANAVSIRSFRNGVVGYLPRTAAARYQRVLLDVWATERAPITCGRLVGEDTLGIYIALAPPTQIAKKLAGVKYHRQTKEDENEPTA